MGLMALVRLSLTHALCAVLLLSLGNGLVFNGIKKEKIKIMKKSLGVRLGTDFKVQEVIDADSALRVDDRITSINGETITDFEFHEFKEVLNDAYQNIPFFLSIERLYLDKEKVEEKIELVKFMENNNHEDILSPELIALGNELGLHMPVVSVKGGKSVDYLSFTSEAAEFSGPFSCEYQTLRSMNPIDGCQISSRNKKKRVYKNSIVIVKRGVCPFIAKALNAQDAGAAGIIIVNTEEKIFPIKDPQAEKVKIPVVMVSKSHGKDFLDMLGDEGGKLAKSISIMSRIAPPNTCLGARQREQHLKDQGLTHAQKVMLEDGSDERDKSLKNVPAVRKVESVFDAMVTFNERKEAEKVEKIKDETDARWIAKSSIGAHGFQSKSRLSSGGLSSFEDIDFGSISFKYNNDDQSIYTDYMSIHGRFEYSEDCVESVFTRLPFHSIGSSDPTLDATYVNALTYYYDEFNQQIAQFQPSVDGLGSPSRFIVIDFAPLTSDEVLHAMNVSTLPRHNDPPMSTMETLRHLRSLFLNITKASCEGLFFLNFPNSATRKSYLPTDVLPQPEFFNWSYPLMNDFAHALVEGGSENLVPPVAVIPFVQSEAMRTLFYKQDIGTSTTPKVSTFLTQKAGVKETWTDMWAVVREVAELPDMRVRKKLFNMMKQKYSGDEDAMFYLKHTLLYEDPVEALARHHRLNKKASARATASSMRIGGHAKRMSAQADLEKERRRSVKRKRVAAKSADETTEHASNIVKTDKTKTRMHVVDEL